MMAIERSEFFVGYCWPLRPHLTESFHPTVAVLTFETRRLPDQKQSITRKMAFDPCHKGSFLRRAEMVERLADPDHVKWTLPSLNCLDEILTAKFDWTSKRGKGVPCDIQRGLGNVDADVASDAGASERYGREGRSAAARIGEHKAVFRLVQENLVEQIANLLVGHVVGGHYSLVCSQTFRKQFLIGRHGCPSRRAYALTHIRRIPP